MKSDVKIVSFNNGTYVTTDKEIQQVLSCMLTKNKLNKMEFKITKEQIKTAYENKEELKKLFPEAFELEIGRWYRNKEKSSIFCFTGCFDREGDPLGFGFANGIFYEKDKYGWINVYITATHQEVENALLQEAKRRGLVKGAKIKGSEPNIDGRASGTIDFEVKYTSDFGGSLHSSGLWIFKDGKWGEVIKEVEVTLDQIAEKFGVSVEELKIKKG